MERKATTPIQRTTLFQLIEKQARAAAELAALASNGDEHPYRAAAHLLGITSYIHELAADIKAGLDGVS